MPKKAWLGESTDQSTLMKSFLDQGEGGGGLKCNLCHVQKPRAPRTDSTVTPP